MSQVSRGGVTLGRTPRWRLGISWITTVWAVQATAPRTRSELASRVVLVGCVLAISVGVVLVAQKSRTTTEQVSVEDVAMDGDGRTVWATVYTNTCGEPDRLVIEETSSEVVVTALVRQRSGECDDIGIPHRMSGLLATPLGSRALRSGS